MTGQRSTWSEKGGMDRIGGLLRGTLRGSLGRFRPMLFLVWTQEEGLTSQRESKREPPDPKIAPLVVQHNQLMHLTHLNLTSPKPFPALPSPPATPLQ